MSKVAIYFFYYQELKKGWVSHFLQFLLSNWCFCGCCWGVCKKCESVRCWITKKSSMYLSHRKGCWGAESKIFFFRSSIIHLPPLVIGKSSREIPYLLLLLIIIRELWITRTVCIRLSIYYVRQYFLSMVSWTGMQWWVRSLKNSLTYLLFWLWYFLRS